MRPLFLSLLLVAAVPSFASDKKPAPQEPVAFGIMSHQTGCVIFEEWHRTTGRWYGIALTTKTEPMLRVLETQNYKLDKQDMPEDSATLNDLVRRAQADHIKYVKIAEKHTPEQLEQARELCKEGM